MKYVHKEDPFGLAPLWNAILDVYCEYAAFCADNGLSFYLCAGSHLGAVRHGGFIPWDDDFDILMPRQDYDRLLDLWKTKKTYLVLRNRTNTANYKILFSKIIDERPDVVSKIEAECGFKLPLGIFIDIYPLDGYPQSWIRRCWYRIYETAYQCVYHYENLKTLAPPRTVRERMGVALGALLAPFLRDVSSYDKYADFTEAHVRKIPFDSDKWSGTGGCRTGVFQRVIPPGYFGTPSMVDFCGLVVPIPEQSDALLRNFYGDYMTLPPEKNRVPSHLMR